MANETENNQRYTIDTEEIETSFTYHAPRPDQIPRYEILRQKAKELAYVIAELCPDSRHKSLARTHLEEAILFANKSIAHEKHPKQ